MIKIRKWLDDLNASLWLRPMGWLFSMTILAVLLITIDRHYLLDDIRDALPWFLTKIFLALLIHQLDT